MIVVSDAVAEIDWTTHEAGLTIMYRIFADVKTTDCRCPTTSDPEGSWEMAGGYPKLIPLGAAPVHRDIRW
jgi:hypothetical protein